MYSEAHFAYSFIVVIHNERVSCSLECYVLVQLVDKIGPLEYILNTPSHHRVHHGVNRYCTDKNFGGVLIIWDHLFGMQYILHFEWHTITIVGLVIRSLFS